jgi:two-component system chemotaxis response regulator CheB
MIKSAAASRNSRISASGCSRRGGEFAEPGGAYFPEEGTHLLVREGGRMFSATDPAFRGHLPSITVTFRSVAASYGKHALGVLLTGMGWDGAEGMKSIFDAGGSTIAQDENTSVVFGMPRQAIDLGAAGQILPIDRIADSLIERCRL